MSGLNVSAGHGQRTSYRRVPPTWYRNRLRSAPAAQESARLLSLTAFGTRIVALRESGDVGGRAMTTATQYGFGVRRRDPAPARHAPLQMPERFRRMQENAERLLAEPFIGVTTDGAVLPGLFPLAATGVSTRPIKDAADAFLASLDGEQRARATFPIDTDAWRRWYNIHPFVMRHGLLLEELDAARREAAIDILGASLSAGGFRLARDVMKLNHTIGEITGSWDEYGEWVSFLSIMGTPSHDQPWGWQIDGHHLNVNCFILKDQLVMTPAFFG